MKYRIKELEEMMEAKQDWRGLIHRTLGWAYKYSLDAGNELPNFADVIWEKDIEEIVAGMKKYGIKEITISSNFSGLIGTLAEFEKHGLKMAGLTEINTPFEDFGTGTLKTTQAIKMVLEEKEEEEDEMTINEIKEIIETTAAEYGFETEDVQYSILPQIKKDRDAYIGITITYKWEDFDFEAKKSTRRVEVTSSVCRMGGNPTPEELIAAADQIRRGAELTKKLQSMDLKYTEKAE